MTKPKAARSNNISDDRMAVEDLLRSLPEGETMTCRQIALQLNLQRLRVTQYLNSMATYGSVVNMNPEKTRAGMWCSTGKAKRELGNVAGHNEFRNSSQPNGDAAYWSRNHAAKMGTPRLSQEAAR